MLKRVTEDLLPIIKNRDSILHLRNISEISKQLEDFDNESELLSSLRKSRIFKENSFVHKVLSMSSPQENKIEKIELEEHEDDEDDDDFSGNFHEKFQ